MITTTMLSNRGTVTFPPVSETMAVKLLSLPVFQGITDLELVRQARMVPGGEKVVVRDRLAAIILLVGTRQLDNPTFQIPMKGRL